METLPETGDWRRRVYSPTASEDWRLETSCLYIGFFWDFFYTVFQFKTLYRLIVHFFNTAFLLDSAESSRGGMCDMWPISCALRLSTTTHTLGMALFIGTNALREACAVRGGGALAELRDAYCFLL